MGLGVCYALPILGTPPRRGFAAPAIHWRNPRPSYRNQALFLRPNSNHQWWDARGLPRKRGCRFQCAGLQTPRIPPPNRFAATVAANQVHIGAKTMNTPAQNPPIEGQSPPASLCSNRLAACAWLGLLLLAARLDETDALMLRNANVGAGLRLHFGGVVLHSSHPCQPAGGGKINPASTGATRALHSDSGAFFMPEFHPTMVGCAGASSDAPVPVPGFDLPAHSATHLLTEIVAATHLVTGASL